MIAIPRTPAEKRRRDEVLVQIERRKNAIPIVRPIVRSDGLSLNPALLIDPSEALVMALQRIDVLLARASTLQSEIASKGAQIAISTPKDEQRLVKEIATARAALAELPDLAYFAFQHAATEWYAVVRNATDIAVARLTEALPECITATVTLNEAWSNLHKDDQAVRNHPNAATIRAENSATMTELAKQIDALRTERDLYSRIQNKLRMVEQIANMTTSQVLGIRLDQSHEINAAARRFAQAQIKSIFN